jgi:hypothetical protein
MYIALNENNKLVNIEQVERGLACQCTCFECGEAVIARKGELKNIILLMQAIKKAVRLTLNLYS